MKERLYLFGYTFQPSSHIDGAILGGTEGALVGLCGELAANVAIGLKKIVDTKIRKVPEEAAKETAKNLSKKAGWLFYAGAAAGIILGSVYHEKAYDSNLKISKKINSIVYSAGRSLSKAVHQK